MRILIIGAVAAGTSAAAKARRNSETAEITIYERDRFISYSGCGMPYYLGGELEDKDELTPRDPAFFRSKYNVDIRTGHEVLSTDSTAKTLTVKNLDTGEVFTDHYDTLILATGATPFLPPIKGAQRENVFVLRGIGDMNQIDAYLQAAAPQTAAVIGTGFIGLEMCESLTRRGISVTLIERLEQVTPGLDSDMAAHVQAHIEKNGVPVYTGASATEISDAGVALADGTVVPAELVILSAGVRPNTALGEQAGVALGETGAIAVDEHMRTNVDGIYACGDCAEHFDVITKRAVWRPLGSTANKTGRIAGDHATGGDLAFRGILGTGIFGIFDLAVAQTGLSEREALAQGFDIEICHNIKPDRPKYMGGKEMVIKAIANRKDGRLLGAQIVGFGGVDKRIDVFVTAITFGAKAEDLFHLDLAYAPPFSTTKDPVMYTGMILDNAISRGRKLITPKELDTLMESGEPYQLIDARVSAQYEKGHVPSAQSIPHAALRKAAEEMDTDTVAVTYCNKGVTGNAAQNILLGKGFQKVYNLSGGHKNYSTIHRKGKATK